jgi:FtsP/CotA-like multicopper oxidase with cupredoxin domain
VRSKLANIASRQIRGAVDAEEHLRSVLTDRTKAGTAEIWRMMTDFHHPIHLRLQPFQVLSRGINGPGSYDAGWKDTIDLRPQTRRPSRSGSATTPARYVFHCHNLEHEDMAMMGNFVVV